MGASKFLAKCTIVPVGSNSNWKTADVDRWISNAGGKMENKLSKETTHLVVDGKTRKKDPSILQKAIEMKNKGYDIKIVSYDWLEDSLNNKSKKQAGPYLWSKLDKANVTETATAPKEARGHVGMLTEVFKDSTDKYVTEAERKKLDKEIEHAKRVKKQMEHEEKEAARKKKEEAALFRQGANKARNEIFSGM